MVNESVASESSPQLTAQQLWLMGIGSMLVAVVALVSFVLPAEYGLDPIGTGQLLGVKSMSGYSVGALSKESEGYVQDEVDFVLAPFESIEYKYALSEGQSMVFQWNTEQEVVFDFHSEEEGTDPEDAVSFEIGLADSQQGTYVAPFSGIHGWFWENRGQSEVVVKLRTTGFYSAATTYSRSGEVERLFD